MSNNERLDICNKALLRAAGVENPKPQYEEPETEQPDEAPDTSEMQVIQRVYWNETYYPNYRASVSFKTVNGKVFITKVQIDG